MKGVKFLALMAIVVMLLSLAPAAPIAAQEGEWPDVIKVGLVNHLTGDAAAYGQSMKKGTEVALKEINDAGGIHGHPVEVIYEDDRLSAADAQTAFLKLVETDKVPVIMGSGSSTVSLSICPKAQEYQVVQISSISTAPSLKDCGEYFFSVMASDVAQGPEWAKVAEHLGVNEAAVMYLNNDYGIGVKDTFVESFQAAGGTVLIAQPFELGAKDFRTEILKVQETNPQVVFIVDHVAEGSIVLKQALELGLDVQWVTDVSMLAQEVIDLAGEASEGVMGLRAGSTQTPEYRKFEEAFVEMHGEPPTIWADFAYDTMMVVAKAIEIGGYDADGIRQALFEVGETYMGASGTKRFDEYGIAEGVYEWMIVKDGQWEVYEGSPTLQPREEEKEVELPEGPIKVGLVNHLTGDAAAYGQSMKKGTEVALKEINDAGGIYGHPLEVIYEDDRLSAADAQTAFLKLVETDKVPVVMGSGSSTVSLSICPKSDEYGVVQISSISTAPSLKDCGPYFFSVMASDVAQGPEWARVAEYLGANEAAVMYLNNDYGIGVKDTFVEAFQAAGGTVLIAQPFELGAKDFRTEILKVQETNPPVVFIVDHVAEGSIVLKQALELGLETQWVTDVSMLAQEVVDLAGEASEGVMGLRAGSTQTPEYRKFEKAFVEMHGEPPTIWADFAYDTMMVVAKAIEIGGYDADGIRQALFEVGETYVGASGTKRFDEYGIAEGVYEWMIVKDGQWVLYEK